VSGRVAIVGSRTFAPLEYVDYEIARFGWGTVVISGGAEGVDQRAEKAAAHNALEVVVHRPDYSTHPPKLAPLMRNTKIAEDCDSMIAFWDGHSRGTLDAITKAVRLGRPVRIVPQASPESPTEMT